jgi:hypothetical protein
LVEDDLERRLSCLRFNLAADSRQPKPELTKGIEMDDEVVIERTYWAAAESAEKLLEEIFDGASLTSSLELEALAVADPQSFTYSQKLFRVHVYIEEEPAEVVPSSKTVERVNRMYSDRSILEQYQIAMRADEENRR